MVMMIDLSGVVVGAVTFSAGFGAKFIEQLIQDKLTVKRESVARAEIRRETLRQRSADFQRASLLALQDNAAALVRFAFRVHHLDIMAFQQSGKWQEHLLPDDLDEAMRAALTTMQTCSVRVRNDQIRYLANDLLLCGDIGRERDEKAAEKTLVDIVRIHQTLNDLIGETVRSLDDEGVTV